VDVLLHDLRSQKKSAPSWLWQREDQLAWVVLDLAQVKETFKRHEEQHKIVIRLLIHEAGHLVMHFHDLPKSTKKRTGAVRSVRADQEEEGWIFAV
jgi:hypothetical protein